MFEAMMRQKFPCLAVFITLFISLGVGKVPRKIAGGTRVSIQTDPHSVSLRYMNNHLCGGSIISQYHILSVASCISLSTDVILGNIKILSGTDDQLDVRRTGEIHDVSIITFHEDYDPERYWINDIAVLTLCSSILFSEFHRPLKLPTKSYYGNIIHTTGWGGFGFPVVVDSTRYLRKSEMMQLTRKKCKPIFRDYHPMKQICAKSVDGTTFSEGDGGNALVHGEEIHGIASVSLADYHGYVIYTKIRPYVSWINSIIDPQWIQNDSEQQNL